MDEKSERQEPSELEEKFMELVKLIPEECKETVIQRRRRDVKIQRFDGTYEPMIETCEYDRYKPENLLKILSTVFPVTFDILKHTKYNVLPSWKLGDFLWSRLEKNGFEYIPNESHLANRLLRRVHQMVGEETGVHYSSHADSIKLAFGKYDFLKQCDRVYVLTDFNIKLKSSDSFLDHGMFYLDEESLIRRMKKFNKRKIVIESVD